MGDGTRGTRIWVARCLTAASQPLAEKLGLAQVVPCEGPSPNSEALAAAAAADVLLLIDAPSKSSSMFLPSKLIDYLMFRKPIFGITPQNGEAVDLLTRLGCLVAPAEHVGAIAAALAQILGAWRTGTLQVDEAFRLVASGYVNRRTAERLDSILQRSIGREALTLPSSR